MARFYIEGTEIDVGDPLFYLPIERVDELINHLLEYRNDYQTHTLAEGQQEILSDIHAA